MSLKIENEFPNIRVIDQLSVALIPRYDFTAIDLVFSTVDVRVMLAKPMLLINPMLTGEDVRRINEYLLADSGEKLKKMQYQQILELLNRKEAADKNEVARGIRSIMGITGGESKLKTLLELMPAEILPGGRRSRNLGGGCMDCGGAADPGTVHSGILYLRDYSCEQGIQ